MLEVTDKGIAMHRRLRGYDDTGEISIGNVLGRNGASRFYGILNES
jgi:hypothetical protein